ncbi:hypothetical protein CEUSTIGMA_g8374.t1 [Chlamydomonas eustigma]|uniref:non-specific serine/threonine protein kinase n=1 Tax=Chlamydomonas eustigma TaxID=1157962 RepID=A0A250XDE8_9CHLO|nr:hypothetical protein CEUSTIGMA_g8374.t1 [Chlamydomonas eustigma]|eukprot:GAX80939.1 hypothetical protein CEUSTIGMA_g8374.t1 [Chlamydomonas eustigma]
MDYGIKDQSRPPETTVQSKASLSRVCSGHVHSGISGAFNEMGDSPLRIQASPMASRSDAKIEASSRGSSSRLGPASPGSSRVNSFRVGKYSSPSSGRPQAQTAPDTHTRPQPLPTAMAAGSATAAAAALRASFSSTGPRNSFGPSSEPSQAGGEPSSGTPGASSLASAMANLSATMAQLQANRPSTPTSRMLFPSQQQRQGTATVGSSPPNGNQAGGPVSSPLHQGGAVASSASRSSSAFQHHGGLAASSSRPSSSHASHLMASTLPPRSPGKALHMGLMMQRAATMDAGSRGGFGFGGQGATASAHVSVGAENGVDGGPGTSSPARSLSTSSHGGITATEPGSAEVFNTGANSPVWPNLGDSSTTKASLVNASETMSILQQSRKLSLQAPTSPPSFSRSTMPAGSPNTRLGRTAFSAGTGILDQLMMSSGEAEASPRAAGSLVVPSSPSRLGDQFGTLTALRNSAFANSLGHGPDLVLNELTELNGGISVNEPNHPHNSKEGVSPMSGNPGTNSKSVTQAVAAIEPLSHKMPLRTLTLTASQSSEAQAVLQRTIASMSLPFSAPVSAAEVPAPSATPSATTSTAAATPESASISASPAINITPDAGSISHPSSTLSAPASPTVDRLGRSSTIHNSVPSAPGAAIGSKSIIDQGTSAVPTTAYTSSSVDSATVGSSGVTAAPTTISAPAVVESMQQQRPSSSRVLKVFASGSPAARAAATAAEAEDAANRFAVRQVVPSSAAISQQAETTVSAAAAAAAAHIRRTSAGFHRPSAPERPSTTSSAFATSPGPSKVLANRPPATEQRQGSSPTVPQPSEVRSASVGRSVGRSSTPPSATLGKMEARMLLGSELDEAHTAALPGYSVGKVIGEGGFCKVRLGIHHLSRRKVAIKIVDKTLLADANEAKRMQREIRVMRHLTHPCVIKLFEVVDAQNYLYLVMEHSQNGSLLDYVRARKRLTEPDAVNVLQQIVAGLMYCHSREVVHRDIKLENILLDTDDQMKLIDFGLSAFYLPGKKLRVHCGSPSYAAPEIVARKQYDGPPTDVWSLGVVLFACLSGFLPFHSSSGDKKELCNKIMEGKYTAPEHLTSHAKDLLSRMLTVDPSKRTTFEGVLSHPWVRQAVKWDLPNSTAYMVKVEPTTGAVYADEQLLQELESGGFVRSKVLQSLLQGEANSMTAAYFLLAEAKAEAHRAKATVGRHAASLGLAARPNTTAGLVSRWA